MSKTVVSWVDGKTGKVANALFRFGLALPLLTTFWGRVYAKLGRAMASSDMPTLARVRSPVWIGFRVGTLGITVSLMSLYGATAALLVAMLANPRGGIQVSAASGGATSYTISAIDAVSIVELLLTQTSELHVAAISLRLVFLIARATREEAAK